MRQSEDERDIPNTRLIGLQRVALALSAARTVEEVAEVIITEGLSALGGNAGSVSLLTEDGTMFDTVRCHGYPPEVAAAYAHYPFDTPLPNADVVRRCEPLFIETLAERNRHYPHLAHNRTAGGRGALAALPLIVGGRAFGGLALSFPEDRSFSPDDRAFMQTIGQLCAQALERAQRYDEARREIAERRQAEAALRESEQQFRGLFDSAAIPMALMTPDGWHLVANEAAGAFLGYTPAELTRIPVRELAHPDDLPAADAAMPRLLSGEAASLSLDLRYIRKDSGIVWGHTVFSLVRDPAGEPKYLIVTTTDITEQKYLEQAKATLLNQTRAAAAQQRAFLRDVLVSVTDGRLRLCYRAGQLPARLSPQGAPVSLSRESGLPELRRLASAAAAEAGLPDDRRGDLLTAVSEAAMNAIVHGGGGIADVSFSRAGTVQARIEDRGTGITMANLPQAALARGFSTKESLGHGFKMMLIAADRVYMLTGGTGTTLVIEMDRIALAQDW